MRFLRLQTGKAPAVIVHSIIIPHLSLIVNKIQQLSFVGGLQLGNYVIGQARDGLKVLAVRDFLPGGRRYRME